MGIWAGHVTRMWGKGIQEDFGVKALGNFLLRKDLERSRNINHSTTTIGLLLLNLYITS
jgi:hypothetical protein